MAESKLTSRRAFCAIGGSVAAFAAMGGAQAAEPQDAWASIREASGHLSAELPAILDEVRAAGYTPADIYALVAPDEAGCAHVMLKRGGVIASFAGGE